MFYILLYGGAAVAAFITIFLFNKLYIKKNYDSDGNLIKNKTSENQADTRTKTKGQGLKTVKKGVRLYSYNTKPMLHGLFGIERIVGNLIEETNGRLSTIIGFSTMDFFALSDDEQTAYEDALIRFCVSAPENYKIVETVASISTRHVANNVKKNLDEKGDNWQDHMSVETRDYALQYMHELRNMSFSTEENQIIKYLCISANKEDYDTTLSELKLLATDFINGLQSTEQEVKLLSTSEIIEILNRSFNHGSRISVDEVVEQGLFETYSAAVAL